jgi:ATP-dependent helicase HrpB
MSGRAALPIDPLLPDVCAAMGRGNLVLVAAPGAGKTTRVPPALLAAGVAGERRIVVLEPRRLAARAAARRVAEEMGAALGGAVGYEVRFERQVGQGTRIVFVTEGLLTRRLMSDPRLDDVGVVLVDEVHERHLTGDLALALLRRAQRGARPDLRIAAMSATIDAAPVAAFLGDCPVIASEGRQHPVEIEHLAAPMQDPLDREVARALGRLLQSGLDGHVLVFLPGAGEIRRAAAACAELAARHRLDVLPLHGSLSSAEQDRALAPSDRRKVVLATNVAETSLTIDGVAAVIDSGLARIARHAPWSGLGALRVEPVSRASAAQRAGRAGRTRAGRCVRLYTRHDHDTRREHEVPEVLRTDLAESVLALRAAGVGPADAFEWLTPPPDAAVATAGALLARLGALDAAGAVTELGRRMLRFPLHPRQARVLIEAERRGAAQDGCLVAAALGERAVRLSRRGPARAAHTSPSDVLDDLDALRAGDPARSRSRQRAGTASRAPEGARRDLDRAAVAAVTRAAEQLGRLVDRSAPRALRDAAVPGTSESRAGTRQGPGDADTALSIALLTGFPDRVARRRRAGAPEVLLGASAGGGAAVLHPSSAVHDAELLLAIDAETDNRNQVIVRTASAIDAAWLYELYTDDLLDTDELRFDPGAERVERVRRLAYDGLVLEETRDADPRRIDRERAAPVLAAAARAAGGLAAFVDRDALARLRARLDFAARACPDAGVAALTDADLDAVLDAAASEAISFAELRAAHLLDRLAPTARRDLDRLAPDAVSLPGRKRVPVQYEPDRPPWIESRLQDFFGLTTGPSVASGRVPLVLHLLAPNQRAVQVTSDLSRFWSVHYPPLRRELSRRYPRHAWPEDPLRPPPAKPPRGR